ncbi:hypothetical protein Ancab_037120 [Ancistrocladus abbreviatus]
MSKFDPYEHLKISLNHDGSLTRNYSVQTLNPNPELLQSQTVASKDATINPRTNTWARIFRPPKPPSSSRLPVIIYFHSGGWIAHSAADILYHEKCTRYATEIPSLVISLNYRLAPEHRLPAQYEDAIDTLSWLRNQAVSSSGDPWLRDYADFSRCYLLGRQNGANIAFNAALRSLDVDLSPLKISGIILNQPMFSGVHRTKSELKYATDDLLPLPVLDLMWELALPKGTDRDHRYCNPMKDGVQQRKIRDLGRCLVIGYGEDPTIDKQQEFVTKWVGCGGKVEAHFDDVGFHGIDLVDSKRAAFNLKLVKEFI